MSDSLFSAPNPEERLTLEECTCGQCFDCPDGWHDERHQPCNCTPGCVLFAADDEPDSLSSEDAS